MQSIPKAINLIGVLCLISSLLWSQDPNFSQYNNLPIYLNPSLSGNFEGSYRATLAHRNQGNSILNEPIISLASSFDLRLPLIYDGKVLNDAAGVGILFMQDRNSALGWNTQHIHLSGSFHKNLDPVNNQFLSVGFQMGIVQKSVGYNNLTFEDQFNGSNNYSDPTKENLPANNFAFSDLSTGLQYSFMTQKQFGGFLGASLSHFNKPNQSFFQNNLTTTNGIVNQPLAMKYTIHGGLQIPINDFIQVHPRFMMQKQASYISGLGGFNLRTIVNDVSNTSIHLGTSVRPVLNLDQTPRLESLVVLLGLELNSFLFGLTYDVGLTNLFESVPGRRNAIEFTLTYMGRYNNDNNFCPKF